MPRKTPAASAPSPSTSLEEQLTDAVAVLNGQLEPLTHQVEVLRIAIDDLRQEVEFAMRNVLRPPLTQTPHLTSMPKNPLAPDFGKHVNRFNASDVPPEPPTQRVPPVAASSVQQGDLFS